VSPDVVAGMLSGGIVTALPSARSFKFMDKGVMRSSKVGNNWLFQRCFTSRLDLQEMEPTESLVQSARPAAGSLPPKKAEALVRFKLWIDHES